jgi:hypothetical protein
MAAFSSSTLIVRLGKNERINVRIEKERKLLFGQKCRVFLNDRLYKCYEGVCKAAAGPRRNYPLHPGQRFFIIWM